MPVLLFIRSDKSSFYSIPLFFILRSGRIWLYSEPIYNQEPNVIEGLGIYRGLYRENGKESRNCYLGFRGWCRHEDPKVPRSTVRCASELEEFRLFRPGKGHSYMPAAHERLKDKKAGTSYNLRIMEHGKGYNTLT